MTAFSRVSIANNLGNALRLECVRVRPRVPLDDTAANFDPHAKLQQQLFDGGVIIVFTASTGGHYFFVTVLLRTNTCSSVRYFVFYDFITPFGKIPGDVAVIPYTDSVCSVRRAAPRENHHILK